MADMSQVNLERIRGCDAMWEENKHPRSDNGQFTSGSGGGGAKVSKLQKGMHGKKVDLKGLTNKQNELFHKTAEAAREHGSGSAEHKAARAEYDKNYSAWEKADAQTSAAKQTLTQAKPKINALRSLAEAANPYKAGSPAESSAKFNSVAKMLKNVDTDAYKYAVQMGKVAAQGGEAAAMKWAEQKQKEIESSDMNPVAKGYHKGRLGIVMKQYQKGGLKQRKEAMEAQQAASKPQASHPMAGEVKKDIDYWLSSQHGGNPSEAQRQRAVESMKAQYDSALRSAEKNWKMAQSVPDLDEATRNSFQKKYETAKGKVEAFKSLYGEQ